MRPSLRLAPVLLLTTSCGLMLDFAEEGTPDDGGPATSATSTGAVGPGATSSSGTTSQGSQGNGGEAATGGGAGGEGGEGGDGGGGNGGAAPSLAWADTFWAADPGAPARIRALAVDGETTWVAGYFAGSQLRLGSKGDEEVVFEASTVPHTVTSFVIALDAAGDVAAKIPVAESAIEEYPTDEYLGTLLLPAGDGSLFVATAFRSGQLLLGDISGNEGDSVGRGWNLVIARVEADGGARWATRCTAVPDPEVAVEADLSAAFAGLTIVDDTLLVGTTYSTRTRTVECESLVGGAAPCSAENLGPFQAALILAIAPDDGACATSPLHIHAPSHSLWLDGLRPGLDSEIFVTGQVAGDDAVLEPWGADLGGGDSIAFRAPLGIDGVGDDADVGLFVTNFYPAVASDDEMAAGSPRNAATASDVAIFLGERTWSFGDPNERTRSEVATSVSAEGGDVLLTGYMTEDAAMQSDLCGEGCEGDLAEHDPCATSTTGDELPECKDDDKEPCQAPGIIERDAYWVLVADEESAPRAAVGRAFGACGNQTIVAGHLGAERISLLIEMEGSATIDVIDDVVPVSIPEGRIGSVLVQMPRPSPSR